MDVLSERIVSPPNRLEEAKNKRLERLERLEDEVNMFRQNILMLPGFDGPVVGTLSHWRATMRGPPSSPYEGQIFELCIDVPQNYPYGPPKVTFLTVMFHPNIDNKGEVSLHILKENKWSSYYNITAVLHYVYHMLAKPSLDRDDVASPDIAIMYETDRSKFESIARSRSLTELYAWERDWE